MLSLWLAAGAGGIALAAYLGRKRLVHARDRSAQESDARTRLILDVALDAVVVMDSDGRIRDWNPQAEIVFGRTRDEVLGTPLADHLLPDELREAHQQAMQTEEGAPQPSMLNQRLETVALRRDGTRFPIEIAITPIPRGEQVEYSAFIRDISDRRAAASALSASEARYRTAFEQAAVGMAEVALDGTFIRVNNTFARGLGYAAAELNGKHLHDIALPDDAAFDTGELAGLVAGAREAAARERQYLRKDGTSAWAWSTLALVRDSQNRPSYALSVMQDVTDRKRLEEELRQGQKMEAVGRLAGGIAHDFNNILAGIMGYADLLQYAPDATDNVRADAQSIASAAQQGADLARNLLTLARRTPAILEPVNLTAIVAEVTMLIARTFDSNIEITTSFTDDELFVNGDRSQLTNALLNLSLNARDAMPAGGVLSIETRCVELPVEYAGRFEGSPPPGSYARVTVTDTGTGMAPATLAKIFDPFFTTKEIGRGTGLGLAMVYGTAKSHGGLIQVVSELGAGTTFSLFIPLALAGAVKAPEREYLVTGSGCVLLADDEPTVRDVAARMMRRLGYEVDTVADGEEVMSIVRKDPDRYDLIILDGDMARLSGPEAAEQLKLFAPGVPVILATGNLDSETEARLDQLGFVAALSKPFSITALSAVMAQHVKHHQGRLELEASGD